MGPRIAVIPLRYVLVALVLLAVGITYYVSVSDRATQIVIYDPTGFKATEEQQGNCFTGSIAAPRAGAFRCIAGNSIFDPSFVIDSAVAFPVGDPEKNQGILIKLTEPLPQPPDAWQNPPDPNNPKPWRTELAGGGVCGVLTGTLPSLDFRLACNVPDLSDSALCMVPVPSAQDPATYVTVCGIFDEKSRDVVNQKAYLVEKMWL